MIVLLCALLVSVLGNGDVHANSCHAPFLIGTEYNTSLSVCPYADIYSQSEVDPSDSGICICQYTWNDASLTIPVVRGPNCTAMSAFDEKPWDICNDNDLMPPQAPGYRFVCDSTLNPPYGMCVREETPWPECSMSFQCLDGNECTLDYCMSSKCYHYFTEFTPCNAGTGLFSGLCFEGTCVSRASYKTCTDCCSSHADCEDSDQCTIERCISDDCYVFPVTFTRPYVRDLQPVEYQHECCTDLDPNTLQMCENGECHVFIMTQTIDETTCRVDTCINENCDLSLYMRFHYDDENECTHFNCTTLMTMEWPSIVYETGTLCSLGRCDNGTCILCTTDIECDDENECTIDICTPTGCSYLHTADGTTCALSWNETGVCYDGVCTSTLPQVMLPGGALVGIILGIFFGILILGVLVVFVPTWLVQPNIPPTVGASYGAGVTSVSSSYPHRRRSIK